MAWEEKESRRRHWIFILVLCCSSNMLVHWFCFYRFASSVRPLFRVDPKMGLGNFRLILRLRGWRYWLCSPLHFRFLTNFQNESSPLLTSDVVSDRGLYHFLVVQNLRRPGTYIFFLSFLITVVIQPWLADHSRRFYVWFSACFSLLSISFPRN